MSLYQKYRPKDFNSLVGQESVKTTLLNSLKNGEASHAYLFFGPRGTGKTSTARILAKALNSEVEENGKIKETEITKEIEKGSFVDVIEIDAASNSGVDNIRELQSKIGFSPSSGKKKIYIVDEVHMLSPGAFNALLKTLEEPPEFVHFILATTEKYKVPETILSRCINFDFKRISEEQITERLEKICKEENFDYEREALELVAKESNGGLRDAISTLEKLNSEGKLNKEEVSKNLGIGTKQEAKKLVELKLDGKNKEALELCKELEKNGINWENLLREILGELREKMLEKVEQKEELQKILNTISNFQKASEEIRFSQIKSLPIEVALLK